MKPALLALAAMVAPLMVASAAHADACDDRVRALQQSWDHVNFEVPEAVRTAEMARLNTQADAVVAQCPNRAEPLVWDAIITASEAGLRGGIGALGLVRDARSELERAERINPRALNGAVYVSLGSLYAQVPGAPLGFGNRQRARDYLQRGLAMAPNDIDANFFMGDLLVREHDWDGAARYLQRAIDAPARPGRAVADRGRKAEARTLLARAQQRH
ncbi:tetratricopeptide repeat protein [Brevundimonas sp. FT23042]|uniref:tetratricopeptide repeat protein n=1 Tax=Brevundimonas sp. FT23042 TaxID=3393749 RepID=UPI003B5889C0